MSQNPNRLPVVMVVDDSKTILQTAQVFLKSICQVVIAEDGFLALARLQDVRPELIFLDVMMPRLDGYTTCMAIKQNPEFSDLPIVMLSSKDSPFDKARGHLMGCDEYLTKPFSKAAIQEMVIRRLNLAMPGGEGAPVGEMIGSSHQAALPEGE